jgi:hypothetical protein
MDERPGEENPPACLGPIAFGIAVSALVHFGVGSIRVSSGEPVVLRWARILADHPVRATLAAALLVVALRPRAISTSGSTTDSTSGSTGTTDDADRPRSSP